MVPQFTAMKHRHPGVRECCRVRHKPISFSIVSMRSALQVTTPRTDPKNKLCMTSYPQSQPSYQAFRTWHPAREKNHKVRKRITMDDFLFPWFQSQQWQVIKHCCSAFKSDKIHRRDKTMKSTKINKKISLFQKVFTGEFDSSGILTSAVLSKSNYFPLSQLISFFFSSIVIPCYLGHRVTLLDCFTVLREWNSNLEDA